ncbi:MAG: hypothetical protein AAF682_05125 [Planctomycetota bacterium]
MILRKLISSVLPAALLAALPVALTGLAGAQAVPTADTTMLRLRDGAVLWGSIVEHDEEVVHFRRLDNGGTVHLRWTLLDPGQEEELRMQFGYVESGVEELMIDADRVALIDGTELVGLITDRTPTELWLKTSEGRLPVPLGRIAGPATVVQVPALDIYTKDELYQQKVFELQDRLLQEGTPAAEAHFELALFCEQLFDYLKALEHYEAVERSDPEYQADVMEAVLDRTREKASLQAQVDHLQLADLWRARRHYDKANTLLDEFPALYPGSPLMTDLAKLRERVAKYQERDLRSEVVRSWHHWTRRFASTAARKMGYEEALAYIDGAMGEEILQSVHQDLQKIAPEILPDEVRALWEEREGGKYRQASYGLGTWMLGEGRARAGLEPSEDDTAAAEGSTDEARKKIEDKIKRYLKNQEIAKKAKTGGDSDDEDPTDFWDQWQSANRTQWVLAYYVENSGDFRVEKVRFRNCRECGGTGTRQVVFTGGAVSGAKSGERIVPCPTCHHIAVVRLIKYR